ncbi:MAG: hypothetical protein WCP03_02355 [Candidatus Saccharibacteria bacterium]
MNFRRFAVWLANFCLGLSICLLATIVSLVFTIGSANYIKNNLTGSGFYDKFTGSVLKLAVAQSANDTNNQRVITELTPSIQKVLTPNFVKTNFENAIDAFDYWLVGKSKTPSFDLDLSQTKKDLKAEVATYLKNKVNRLPLCQNFNDSSEFDPINATCRYPINLTEADYQLTADNFVSTVPLLDKQTISFDSLDQTNTKKTAWQKAPLYNKLIRISLWFLTIIILLGIVLIFLLSLSRASALKVIGHTFVWSGGMLLVSGALAIFVLGRNSASFMGRGSAEQVAFVQELLAPLLSKLTVSFGNWALYFGAGYALFGALCYILSHKMRLNTIQNDKNDAEKII